MLKRLWIDNYKCFVNFQFEAQSIQLLLGRNGAGKSTVFEVLEKLRGLVTGESKVEALFPVPTLTRWMDRPVQAFQLDVAGNGGSYEYRIEVEHRPVSRQSRVLSESLKYDQGPLFSCRLGDAQLYRDDHSAGPAVTIDWSQSGLSMLGRRPDNARLIWFREWLSRVLVVRVDPFRMGSESEHEEAVPRRDMSNFASWYRHLALEALDLPADLSKSVGQIWESFRGLRFARAGEHVRLLKVVLAEGVPANGAATSIEQSLEELSDGQRVLLVLYTLLEYVRRNPCSILCIDEPDNFIALPEIQPWLLSLRDVVEEQAGQVYLISHHPEVLNLLAPEAAVYFQRRHGGPALIASMAVEPETALTPAELIARGWPDEQ